METTLEKIRNEWTNLEHYMGFEVPVCLKFLLWKSGYDSTYSVKQICEKKFERSRRIYTNKSTTNIAFARRQKYEGICKTNNI